MANVDWAVGSARQNMPQCLYGSVAYNTASIATGVNIGTIPANSIITDCWVKVTTTFNAGTTNVLQVGKLGTLGAYMGTSDVNEASATAQRAVTGLGDVGTSDIPVLVSYTQTGTAASQGAAICIITYFQPSGNLGVP